MHAHTHTHTGTNSHTHKHTHTQTHTSLTQAWTEVCVRDLGVGDGVLEGLPCWIEAWSLAFFSVINN